VWTTSKRIKFLRQEIRSQVFNHILSNGIQKGIYIDQVNGYNDHVHCLIGLNANQNISTIMQLLKGESACWINKKKLTRSKFKWQKEYYAVSVSIHQLNTVRNYIKNQEKHHQTKTLKKELSAFRETYNLD
jgi:REP element-mobilizing transposase RayT